MDTIEAVFDYTDFREYLSKFYEKKKRENPHFSYQLLAQKAGFKNREFLYSIIKGTKRLSGSRSLKLSHALGHTRRERDYFVNMVHATQAENDEELEYYRMQMLKIKNEPLSESEQIKINQYEFFSTWYHHALYHLLNIYPFRDDYEKLGQQLTPPITAVQAKSSVELLERLGMIVRDPNGIYCITGRNITAGPEISEMCRKRYLKECTVLSRRAIEDSYPAKCTVHSVMTSMTRRTYEYIMEEMEKFKKRVKEYATNDESADRVYLYQFTSFPLSVPETVDTPSEELQPAVYTGEKVSIPE